MKKLLSVILSIAILLSFASVTYAADNGDLMQKTKLTVGINAEFEPFEYYDENGNLTGFDIDLMNYIGEKIEFEIEYKEFPFDRLLPAVASGEVDCAISAITITDERDGIVDYTEPYLTANVVSNGEKSVEEYGIIFPANSIDKARLIEAANDPYPSKYMLVNNAVLSLKKDGTILKLIEKYELNNKTNDDENYKATYSSIVTTEDTKSSGKIADMDILRYETPEEIGLTYPHPSEWAAKDVDFAYKIGIADKQYFYQSNITREQFCELIYNLIVLANGEITAPVTDSFTDTKNEKILMLSGLGIINGKSATEFAPSDYLTREEAATVLWRMFEKGYIKATLGTTAQWIKFDDEKEISDWALINVQNIYKAGIMNGVGNNKFAPKETYTTEQAIVTLARVYKSAEAAGAIDYNSSIGIIGGADGPTEIIVGDNINIIDKAEYEKFYAEIQAKTTTVNNFYIDEALRLIREAAALAADKNFISLYTTNEEITSQILKIGAADYSKPSAIYHLSADKEQIIANINALAGEEVVEIDLEKLLNHKKLSFAVLPSLINSSYGHQNLAALTVLSHSRGYVMPKDFKDNFALYLAYDEGASALVTFSEFGDGVISANMSFIINGDTDNIFKRIYEITQAAGENSFDVSVVK